MQGNPMDMFDEVLAGEATVGDHVERSAGHSLLIVDFRRVSYISSSGLKALLVALRSARSQGGDLRLCGMNDRVCEVFTLSGFHKVFSIHPSEQQAAAAFHSSEAI